MNGSVCKNYLASTVNSHVSFTVPEPFSLQVEVRVYVYNRRIIYVKRTHTQLLVGKPSSSQGQ